MNSKSETVTITNGGQMEHKTVVRTPDEVVSILAEEDRPRETMNQYVDRMQRETAEQTARWRAKHALAQTAGNRVADRETDDRLGALAYHLEFNRVMGMTDPVECAVCGWVFDNLIEVGDDRLCEDCINEEQDYQSDHAMYSELAHGLG